MLYFVLNSMTFYTILCQDKKKPTPEHLPFSIGRYHTTMKAKLCKYLVLFRETDSTVRKLTSL